MLRNLTWNLAGVILPLFAAAVSAPILLTQLGSERFGLLTLAWTLIGYFSIFDLGLGRSIAKIVSQRLGEDPAADVAPVIWTAVLTALGMGILGGLATAYWAETLIDLMKLDASLRDEAVEALRALALVLPFVVTSSILAGALEAYHRFDIVNMLRIPAGLINFLAPLAVIPFTLSMTPIVLVLGGCKLGVTLGYLLACSRIVRNFRQRIAFQLSELYELISFGGWITLGNILHPIVAYTDRFLITAYVSVTIVGYYVVPYEVLMRVLVPVIAITAVLFPTFSQGLSRNQQQVGKLYNVSLSSVMLLAFPLTFIIATWSEELLLLWLNAEVAQAAGTVTKLFALGIFLTCMNQVTLTLVQARGHPDWIPKLFLAELPVYLPCLIWAVKHYGITGAALAWLARILVDLVFLFWFTAGSLPFIRAAANRNLPYLLMLAALFVATHLDMALTGKILLSGTGVSLAALTGWFFIFSAEERTLLLDRLKLRKTGSGHGA